MCPAGTYNYQDASGYSSDCWSCPPGFYCPAFTMFDGSQPLILPSNKIQTCPAGMYCTGGNSAGVTCPAGYYCPLGSNIPIPCDNGAYCSTTGLVKVTGVCQEGYFCEISLISPTPSDKTLCVNQIATGCVIGATSKTH